MRIGSILTSKTEIKDLLKAWIAISLAFAIVLGRGFTGNIFYALAFSALTAGIGFLLHELAHKFTAQHYGCFAEFRANDQMLILAVLISFFNIVFAAPGAVYIAGQTNYRRNGIIALAGPLTNIVLAIIFYASSLYYPLNILKFGAMINVWLGLFNIIPIANFDGRKIWIWNRRYYVGLCIVTAVLFFKIAPLG